MTKKKPSCVVLTGAGISADSGLKTFRDEGGLWEGHHVEDVATWDAFERNPALVIDFYNQRRRQLLTSLPNAAHFALHDLEAAYDVTIITQNVDDLHERAGSHHVIHLHGELRKLQSSVDENHIVDWDGDQKLTDLDPNGYAMRPYIVWFGELVPAIDEAVYWVQKADILMIVGTSLKVYPAAGLMHFARASVPIYLVDPKPSEIEGVRVIQARAKEGVPELVGKLMK